jgi:tetratricopeptide (TPR) repeat protein
MLILAAAAMLLQPSPAVLRQLFEEEFARCQAEYGDSDRRTAQASRDLALFLIRQGITADARSALSQTIRRDEASFGANHPQTLTDVAELAAITPRAQAEELWMRAARSSEVLVAARSLAALGQFRENAGDRTAAARLYRDSLAKEETAGRDTARVAVRLNALARVVAAEEAIGLLMRALSINRSKLGPRHHETATVESNLANMLLASRKWDEAARLSEHALSVFEEVFGKESDRVNVAATILAQACRARGKTAAAEEIERRYLSGK